MDLEIGELYEVLNDFSIIDFYHLKFCRINKNEIFMLIDYNITKNCFVSLKLLFKNKIYKTSFETTHINSIKKAEN